MSREEAIEKRLNDLEYAILKLKAQDRVLRKAILRLCESHGIDPKSEEETIRRELGEDMVLVNRTWHRRR